MSILEKQTTIHFGFLATPGFSLIAYAAAIDTLLIANRLKGFEIYTWDTITPNDGAVRASNGLEIEPTQNLQNASEYEIVFVCGGTDTPDAWSESVGDWLRQQDKKGVKLGSLCAGTYILAKAGLLDGYRCTIHWENIASTRNEFPLVKVSDDIYEIDRDRYTCAGGTAAIDMMHHIVSMQHGRQLAAAVCEEFLVEHVRGSTEQQSIPLHQKIGANQPELMEAISLMEANIEDPFRKDELANLVNITKRQLDRLFKNYLNCSSTQYYLKLRLRNARRLLLQTEISVADISKACGFSSSPHFSRCYKDAFGLPPRDERRLLLARPEPSSLTDAVDATGKETT